MCKISVVVPVYNAELYLAECIESILNQTLSDIELLLVDDGSADSSLEICQRYAHTDSRVRVLPKQNGGVSSARNLGISEAVGEYITFVDSDDYIRPNYCESLLSHISVDTAMAVLGLEKTYPDGQAHPIRHRFASGEYRYGELIKKLVDDGTLSGFSIHSSCAVLFDAATIRENKLRFNENIKYNEDGLFNTAYVLVSGKNVYIDYNEIVYSYRTNLASATQMVDPFSQRYCDSMNHVKCALKGYSQLYPDADINAQMARREATLALSRLMYLAKKQGLTRKAVKNELKSGEIKSGLKLLLIKDMGKQKAAMALAMKLGCYGLISKILNMRLREENGKQR